MGIEAISGACLSFGKVGSIGSAIGSVASAVGRGVSSVGRISVEAGPAVGHIGRIVNEGQVNLADLKNTVPLGEIRFNEPLSVPDVLAEAESIIVQAQRPAIFSPVTLNEVKGINPGIYSSLITQNDNKVEPAILPQVEPMIVPFPALNILEFPKPKVVVSPAAEPFTKTENATTPQTQLIEEKEELIEESVIKESPKESLEEEEIVEKRLHLEDEEASVQRKYEIREAIVKAKVEADRLGLKKITGWLVAKFLPPEYEGNRSQIIKKKGPDGSYQETVEEIAGVGELESEEQAVNRFDKVVAEKKPIKWGKEGTPVENKDVARVFKYRLVKPAQAHAEVVKRVIKKSSVVSIKSAGVNTNPPQGWTEETSLKDYPSLTEVFPKHWFAKFLIK